MGEKASNWIPLPALSRSKGAKLERNLNKFFAYRRKPKPHFCVDSPCFFSAFLGIAPGNRGDANPLFLLFMTLQFCIITPDSIFLNAEADEIILPTNTGQMGVLTGHAPLITALDIGVLLYRSKKKWISLALMGGFALVQQNNITVLVNEAENSSTIDPQEAQKTFELARQQFIEATNPKQKVSANFAFKRAQARYQVVQ